jgi:MFS family permease
LGAGRIVARIGQRTIMVTGLVLGAVGLAVLSAVDEHTGYWAVLLPAQLVIGMGIGAALTTVTKSTLDGVQPGDAGVASALTNAMRQIGGAVGVSALNVVAISVTATRQGVTREAALTDGYIAAFLAGAGLLTVAALIALIMIRPRLSTH